MIGPDRDYAIAHAQLALSMAEKLGFQDDIEHWTKELKELEAGK